MWRPLVAPRAGGKAPFGEAVAAEPSQDHHVNVLYVGPHAQVLSELREGVGLGKLLGRHEAGGRPRGGSCPQTCPR